MIRILGVVTFLRHTYIHTCMHAYIHTYVRTYIHICIYVYIYIYACIHVRIAFFWGGTQTVAWNVGFRRKVGRRTGRAALSMATEPRLQCWCARSKLQPRLFSTTAPKLSASCSALLCALYPEAEASMTVTCSSSLP